METMESNHKCVETNHKHKLNNVICRFFPFLHVDSAELCVCICAWNYKVIK